MATRDALAMTVDFDAVVGSFSYDLNDEAVYEPIAPMVKDGDLPAKNNLTTY